LTMFPELSRYADIDSMLISNMFSEDMRFDHYNLLMEEIKKQIHDGIKQGLEEIVAGLKKSATPIASGNTPVVGMNAIVNNGVMEKYADLTETERKIVEIMDEGGPFAMQKAMKLVIGDDDSFYGSQTAQQQINSALAKATRADFNRGGVIMAKNFTPKIYTETEPTK